MSYWPVTGPWIVRADDAEVGRFEEREDADNFASAWNSAYPGPPEFVVSADPADVPWGRIAQDDDR